MARKLTSTTYGYDNRSELTQETSQRAGGYSNGYGYDLVGNPTTWKGNAQSFNLANQNTQNGTLTFDGNGNPAGWQGTPLSWDANNNVTAVGSVLTAGYDADGLRAWKQTAAGRTYYLYDGIVPVCETDASGNVIAVNTWGANGLLSRHTTGSVFYCFDPQGSVSVRLDSGGNVLSSHCNEAWGTQVSTGSGYASDPYVGYGGQWGYYKDSETGLHLLGHRYYDASTGRFLNRDPIGYGGGMNLYAYSESNPQSRIDPDGYASIIRVGPWWWPSHYYIKWPGGSIGFWPGNGVGIPLWPQPGQYQQNDPHDGDGEGTPIYTIDDPQFDAILCDVINNLDRQHPPNYAYIGHNCGNEARNIWNKACNIRDRDEPKPINPYYSFGAGGAF